MRSRTAGSRLLIGVLVVAACAEPAPAPSSARLDTLRVLDINVWSGLDYQGTLAMGEYESDARREQRYRALLAQLRALAPDVIGVHEANPIPGYVRRLAGDLGYDAVMHMGLGGVRAGPVGLPWNLREGDAILARPALGLRDEGRRRLSGGPVGSFFSFHFSDATQVVAASIGVNGRRIPVFATHWHAGDAPADSAWRDGEAIRTLAFVEEVAGDGIALLMGDFNATAQSPAVGRLLRAGFTDAHGAARGEAARPTWDPGRNRNIREHYAGGAAGAGPELDAGASPAGAARRIDLILVRGGATGGRPAMSVLDARVVLDSVVEGVHASDHFGVLAELALPATPPPPSRRPPGRPLR